MSWARVISFVVLTIIGSLLQIWVVCLILAMRGNPSIEFAKLFADGNLFFFATSLVYGSWFSLFSSPRGYAAQAASFAITLLCVGIVTLLSLVAYSTSAYEAIRGNPLPFPAENYLAAQIVCAIISVVYAFYVCVVTGMFSYTEVAPQAKQVTEHV